MKTILRLHLMKGMFFMLLFSLVAWADLVVAQSQTQSPPPSPLPPEVSLPQIIPASPEAATLIRNIQFPVNYAQGMVDISIPLYEVVVGDVTIPITLSYNHKGLRPLEYSHYLGQGWTLNAEPAITRKTNGVLDRDCVYRQFTSEPVDQETLRSLANPDQYDAFPDEYYYRISGKSGAFIIKSATTPTGSQYYITPPSTPSNNVITIPYEPIKVGYNPLTNSPTDSRFTIIDDNGITYTFDAVETSYTEDDFYGNPTSWKCTGIQTPKGDITFSYYNKASTTSVITEYTIIEDKKLEITSMYPFSQWLRPVIQKHTIEAGDYGYFRYYNWQEMPGRPDDRPLAYDFFMGDISHNGKRILKNSTIENKRINRIDFPQGYVTFNMSGDRLADIRVYANNPTSLVRMITFGNEYTQDNYPFLSSLTISGAGVDEEYRFSYYRPKDQNGVMNGPLPKSMSTEREYFTAPVNLWGYRSNFGYNEALEAEGGALTNNAFSLDVHYNEWDTFNPDQIYYYGLGREISMRLKNASANGVLKSITTKSGLITEYEYESDKFSNTMPPNETSQAGGQATLYTGGLRIKNIRQHDHTGLGVSERSFKYGEYEDGFGKSRVNVDPKYFISTRNVYRTEENGYAWRWRERIINSSMKYDASFSGIPIVYDCVTEYVRGKDTDGVVKKLGKVVYRYNWIWAQNDPYLRDDNGDYVLPRDNRLSEWQNGKLMSKETYRYDGDEYSMIHSSAYNYSGGPNTGDYLTVRQAYVVSTYTNLLLPDLSREEVRCVSHTIMPGATRLASQTDTSYTDNGTISTTTSYTYNYHYDGRRHLNPVTVTTTNSDGRVYQKSMKYSQDASSATGADLLTSRNILNSVIEQTEKTGNITTSMTRNQYALFNSMPLPQKLTVNSEDRIIFNSYDNYGNPLFVTKDGITNVVYLWGYGGQYVVAMIENATESQVQSVLSGVNLKASNITDANLTALRNSPSMESAAITTYKYQPLVGVTEITGPHGAKTYYDYDSKGRLISVRDDKGYHISGYSYNLIGATN